MSNQPNVPSNVVRSSQRRLWLSAGGAAAVAATMRIPRVHAAGSDVLKVALIGCGGRGTGAAAQALNTSGPVVLWAMADLFEERLNTSYESLARGVQGNYDVEKHSGFQQRIDCPPERRFAGFDAYKHAIDSGVDVALLTTFPHFRPQHYEYCVRKGVHVFQEKPLAVDAPGVRRILAADKIAKEKGLKVVTGLQRHHSQPYLDAMPRIHDGAIGDILYLRCYWNQASAGGLRPRGDETEMVYQLRNKYVFTWLCGDHNVEQHIHNIDVCNWVMKGHPLSANGLGGRQFRNGREHGEIFDHHAVEYKYPGDITMVSQCRQIPNCWSSISEHVHGSRGYAYLDQPQTRVVADGVEWRSERARTNPYQVEHDVLFDAIRNDKPHNETEYSAISTLTAIMGRMATYSGKQVTWDEAFNSDLALVPDRYDWDATPPVLPDENGVYPCAMPGRAKGW